MARQSHCRPSAARPSGRTGGTLDSELELDDIPELPDHLAGGGVRANPAFPVRVVKHAWVRAAGGVVSKWAACECMRVTHDHGRARCGKRLAWKNRGRYTGPGAWEANHRHREASGGPGTLSNCEILCWGCHRATFSVR